MTTPDLTKQRVVVVTWPGEEDRLEVFVFESPESADTWVETITPLLPDAHFLITRPGHSEQTLRALRRDLIARQPRPVWD